MAWIALSDGTHGRFDPAGIDPLPHDSPLPEAGPNTVLNRGSLVIEIRGLDNEWLAPILDIRRSSPCPFCLRLGPDYDGALHFQLGQGDHLTGCRVPVTENSTAERLRLTYSWDVALQTAQLTVVEVGADTLHLHNLPAPQPIPVDVFAWLVDPGKCSYPPGLSFLALSTDIVAAGPAPSLCLDTIVSTLDGPTPVGHLRRGDMVVTGSGEPLPVLATLCWQVPAMGSFKPLQVRPPYFGLRRPITMAPFQRLFMSGNDVEDLFGHEHVLVAAEHLPSSVRNRMPDRWTVQYAQILLPRHARVRASGAEVESLYFGEMGRNRDWLVASHLDGRCRVHLPDHGAPASTVLGRFAASVLTEGRAA
ncbi:Hint domain-containing protein [Chachezhania sediminis]|uniref:Hint domain-containing protein n=1 Tax=Chachezhania sediminis TaxID=2599291 RepID=UPI00131D5750|nr:Hint domain-containing protein [Chachezhania sediminis]